jgi:hypothetical protein
MLTTQLLQALPLVLQHSADMRLEDTCRLLQVSREVRAAVQRSSAAHSIRVHRKGARAAGMSRWLPAHAGLVAQLHLYSGQQTDGRDNVSMRLQQLLARVLQVSAPPAAADVSNGLQQLLARALQVCAPPAAAAPAGERPALVPPLRLRSFSTDTVLSTDVVHLLAALNSLTALTLSEMSAGMFTPAVCAALARLTTLEELTIEPCKDALGEHMAAALAPLRRLTHVRLSNVSPAAASSITEALPGSLQCVELDEQRLHAGAMGSKQPVVVQLQHLSSLRELTLGWRVTLSSASALPAGLSELHAVVGSTHPGEQLRQLAMQDGIAMLGRLAEQTALVRLTALLMHRQLQQAGPCLAACRSLHTLDLRGIPFIPLQRQVDSSLVLSAHLAQLPLLRCLHLCNVPLPQRDLLQLTALTRLLDLSFWRCATVDALVVNVLALALTRLWVLHVSECGAQHEGTLPVVARACPHLSVLTLVDRGMRVTAGALMQLTQLRELTLLVLHEDSWGWSQEHGADESAFLQRMPALRDFNRVGSTVGL